MDCMARIPESTKTSLQQRLSTRARDHWPQLSAVQVRYRAGFAYVDAALADGEVLKLRRLRQHVGLRDLPGQPRRLPGLLPAHRHDGRHRRRRPRHRLRPLPQRPHRLDLTPDELPETPTRFPDQETKPVNVVARSR